MDEKNLQGPRLLLLGSPLLDVSLPCRGQQQLAELGLREGGCERAGPEQHPLLEEAARDPTARNSAGGQGLNMARIANWMLAGRGEVAFAGCVGNDSWGSWLESKLEGEGVRPLLAHHNVAATGLCLCLLSEDGERTMCCRQGAASMYSVEHLRRPSVQDALAGAHLVFGAGYFLFHSLDALSEMVHSCTEQQVVSLSLSAAYVCRSRARDFQRLLPRVNILFGNEDEYRALAEELGLPPNATMDKVLTFLRRPTASPCISIATRGAAPVLVDDGTTLREVRVGEPPVHIADTIGCGDALAGAVLAIYALTGGDLEKAIHAGIQAAREIIQKSGCDYPKNKVWDLKTKNFVNQPECQS